MANIGKIEIDNTVYDIKDNHSTHYFNTVADLKASTGIKNGDYVETLGYYSIDDGGKGKYLIRTKTNNDTINDRDIIGITNDNTIIAEYLNNKKQVNPLVFGAKGDGTTDDTVALQFTFDYAKDNKVEVYIPTPSSFYKVTDGLTIPSGSIGLICESYSYSGIIRGYGSDYTILTIEDSMGFYCKNLSIGGNNRNSVNGIYFTGEVGLNIFEHIRVYNLDGYGFRINDMWDSVLTDISIELCGNATNYAFSFNESGYLGTCNMTNVNRLQVEQSYEKSIYINPNTINCNFYNIHSERLNFTDDSAYAWSFSGGSCRYDGVRLDAANNLGDVKNLIYFAGDRVTYNNVRVDSNMNITCDAYNSITINNSKLYNVTEKSDQTGLIYINTSVMERVDSRTNLILDNCIISKIVAQWSADNYKTLFKYCDITTLIHNSTHCHFTLDNCNVSNLVANSVRKAIVKNSNINKLIKDDETSTDKIAYSTYEIYNSYINNDVGIDGSTIIIHDTTIDGDFYHQYGNDPYSFVNLIITGTVSSYDTVPTNAPPKLTKTDNLQPNSSSARGWIYNGSTWVEY